MKISKMALKMQVFFAKIRAFSKRVITSVIFLFIQPTLHTFGGEGLWLKKSAPRGFMAEISEN